eukprot:scaffold4887_cov153-Skeletonema_menzelii.AAC.2
MTKLSYCGGKYTGQVSPEKRKHKDKVNKVGGRMRRRRRLVPNGYGTLVFDNDVSYCGWWKGGFEHGHGVIRWVTGEQYIGFFRYGSPDPNILRKIYQAQRKIRKLGG